MRSALAFTVVLLILSLACGPVCAESPSQVDSQSDGVAPAETPVQAPVPVQAQTPHATLTQEEIETLLQDKNRLALYHYGSRYTFDVLLAGIGGGILGAALYGGPVATISGSTAGALLGILWFLDGYAGEMLDAHGW